MPACFTWLHVLHSATRGAAPFQSGTPSTRHLCLTCLHGAGLVEGEGEGEGGNRKPPRRSQLSLSAVLHATRIHGLRPSGPAGDVGERVVRCPHVLYEIFPRDALEWRGDRLGARPASVMGRAVACPVVI